MYSTPTSRRPSSHGSYISASGSRGIDLAVAEQSEIDIVHAHGPVIRTADAAKQRLVVGGRGSVDVDEVTCGIANGFNKFGRSRMLVIRMRLSRTIWRCSYLCKKRSGRSKTAQER